MLLQDVNSDYVVSLESTVNNMEVLDLNANMELMAQDQVQAELNCCGTFGTLGTAGCCFGTFGTLGCAG